MSWHWRYRLRHFVGNTIWVFPVVGMFAALVMARILYWIDIKLDRPLDLNLETARALLAMLASSMFTFIVFVSSALLVAVQLASAQLTPRIIGLVFRSPVTRASLTLFVFTFTLSLAVLV